MESINLTQLLFASAVGILPSIFWVWFWNKEDRLHPEPRKFLILMFIAGMLVVPVVIPLQLQVEKFIFNENYKMLVWVAIEEILKFATTYFLILKRREIVDEPIDVLIYTLTVAFGFSATENVLFLTGTLSEGTYITTLLTGNLRFLGASLLHALSSCVVGVFLAFEFYKSELKKKISILFGLLFAIAIHFAFNYALLNLGQGDDILRVFSFVWVGFVFLIPVFEKVKRIHN